MTLSLALYGRSGANQQRNVVEADGAEPRDVLCLSLSLFYIVLSAGSHVPRHYESLVQ